MRIEFQRSTLAAPVEFSGVGLHSGEFCRVILRPGSSGIVFSRCGARYEATPRNVTNTDRSTSLGPIRTVEHLLSALAGAEITDAEIEVEGDELPILDGSAQEYLTGINRAGVQTVGAPRACRMQGDVHVREGAEGISVCAGDGLWRYEFERDNHWLGRQTFEVLLNRDSYAAEIAPARTFVFEEEVQQLLRQGLGKGGTQDNTLVIGTEGYLTNSRFPDEPPRHKLLDCVGDLALSGIPARFLSVAAERSGHRLHVKAALKLVEACQWEDR